MTLNISGPNLSLIGFWKERMEIQSLIVLNTVSNIHLQIQSRYAAEAVSRSINQHLWRKEIFLIVPGGELQTLFCRSSHHSSVVWSLRKAQAVAEYLRINQLRSDFWKDQCEFQREQDTAKIPNVFTKRLQQRATDDRVLDNTHRSKRRNDRDIHGRPTTCVRPRRRRRRESYTDIRN